MTSRLLLSRPRLQLQWDAAWLAQHRSVQTGSDWFYCVTHSETTVTELLQLEGQRDRILHKVVSSVSSSVLYLKILERWAVSTIVFDYFIEVCVQIGYIMAIEFWDVWNRYHGLE